MLTGAASSRAEAPPPSPSTSTPAPSAAPAQVPVPAEGANPAEIVAARELFREGTEDADAGKFIDGLQKFKRVAAVKETAAVRFNIARCEEALGRTGAALADFELAAREGGQDAKAEDVAKLATQRADALRPRVPRLTVVPPAPAPEGMGVSLDGGRLASVTLAVGLPVDPGAHVVDATAPGRSPFHAELSLAAGETKRVELLLPPRDPVAPDPRPTEHAERASSQDVWGWGLVGGGGAIAIASTVFLVLHNNAVADLNRECPGGRCNTNLVDQSQVQTTESNARMYEGVSIGLLAAGALAIGGGVILIATTPRSAAPAVSVTTGAAAAPAGLTLRASF